MKIFRATKKDISEIIQKVEALVSELCNQPFKINESEILPFLEKMISDGDYIVLLAKDQDDRVAGLLTLGKTGAVYAGGKFGVIHELYIEPNMRSDGVGKQLLEEAKKLCAEFGWKRLEVGAPAYPEWRRTKEFYLREGFIEIGPRLRWKA
ncbi:MAG: GNAT family N-acetyltransferase [Deltaproteobacteria bacterium]|nr:GNAT family N-acetyltransferase [Deltaproteobacteria bacterium]